MIGVKLSNPNKAKGNSWERELSKYLSSIFNDSFIRVPNSGAFIGGKNIYRKQSLSENQIRRAKSDIQTPDNLPYLVFEAKFYSDFSFHHLFTENKQLDVWISQVLTTIDEKDCWFIAFKINRKGSYICFSSNLNNHFILQNHLSYKSYTITDLKTFIEGNVDKLSQIGLSGI